MGSDVIVRPGELNIMTAGHGVSHSEFAVLPREPDDGGPELPLQRGLQLWVALPDGERHRASGLRAAPGPARGRMAPGFTATVMVGSFAGAASPATMYSPIVGADISCGGAGTPAARPGRSSMRCWCSTAA